MSSPTVTIRRELAEQIVKTLNTILTKFHSTGGRPEIALQITDLDAIWGQVGDALKKADAAPAPVPVPNYPTRTLYAWYSLGKDHWMRSCWKASSPEEALKIKEGGAHGHYATEIFNGRMQYALVREVTTYEIVDGPHKPEPLCICKDKRYSYAQRFECPKHGPPSNANCPANDPQPAACPECNGGGKLREVIDPAAEGPLEYRDTAETCPHCGGSGGDPRDTKLWNE